MVLCITRVNQLHRAQTGVMGMRIGKVLICEENRQSTWESTPEDVRILCGIMDDFERKGIAVVLFGIYHQARTKYALFVQDGFLTEYVPSAQGE
jgi:hypothetical protein